MNKKKYLGSCFLICFLFLVVLCFNVNGAQDDTVKEFKENPSLENFEKLTNPTYEDFSQMNEGEQEKFLFESDNVKKNMEIAKKYLEKLDGFSENQIKIAKDYFSSSKNVFSSASNKDIFSKFLTNGLNIAFKGFLGDSSKIFLDSLGILSDESASINLDDFKNSKEYGFQVSNGKIEIVALNHKKHDSKQVPFTFSGELRIDDNGNININSGTLNGINIENANIKAYKDGLIDIKSGTFNGYEIRDAETVNIVKQDDGTVKIYASVSSFQGLDFAEKTGIVFVESKKFLAILDKGATITGINKDINFGITGDINMDYDVLLEKSLIIKAGYKTIINGNLINAVKRDTDLSLTATLKTPDEYGWIKNKDHNLVFYIKNGLSDENNVAFSMNGNDFSYTFDAVKKEIKSSDSDENIKETKTIPEISFKDSTKNYYKKGDNGDEIRALQVFLGYQKTDGIYDDSFTNFIKKWQSENGVSADGIFGKLSYEALKHSNTNNNYNFDAKIIFSPQNGKSYTSADSGNDVKELQKFFGLEQTGVYDNVLINSIKKWQSENKLTSDGFFGKQSFAKLQQIISNTNNKKDSKEPIEIYNIDGAVLYEPYANGKNTLSKISSFSDALITIGEKTYIIKSGKLAKINDDDPLYGDIVDIQIDLVDYNNKILDSAVLEKNSNNNNIVIKETGTGSFVTDYVNLIDLSKIKIKSETVLKTAKELSKTMIDGGENALEFVIATSNNQKVDPRIVLAIIAAESGGKHKAVSYTGCAGLFQFCYSTAYGGGFNEFFDQNTAIKCKDRKYENCKSDSRFNPEASIQAGTKYISQISDYCSNNINCMAMYYNGGIGIAKECRGKTGNALNSCIDSATQKYYSNPSRKAKEIKSHMAKVKSFYDSISLI